MCEALGTEQWTKQADILAPMELSNALDEILCVCVCVCARMHVQVSDM